MRCRNDDRAAHHPTSLSAQGRTRSKDSIYSVVLDGEHALCHTEATLDVWWRELPPEEKAALYELHLEGALDEPSPSKVTVKLSLDTSTFSAHLAELQRIVDQAIARHTPTQP